MAHSFIQAHDDEVLAFEHFARSHPQGLVLLIDTYDAERAAGRVVALAPRLAAQGIAIAGVAFRYSAEIGAPLRELAAELDRRAGIGGKAA